MDTANMNTNVSNINNIRFSDVWTGSASEVQSDALDGFMQDLNKCIEDIALFDAILVLREMYIKICSEISKLSSQISACASSHGKEEEENGCGNCGALAAKIQELERQRKELREKIIGMLGQFSGINPEVAPPVDLTPHDDEVPPELQALGLPPGEFPLYDQNDYKGVPFGSGDVASSGCGITCAAMVISAYTGMEITPDILANEYNIRGVSNAQRMEEALNGYGIVNANNWRAEGTFDEGVNTYHYDDVKQKISEGYTAIILMNEGNFTGAGHFVLATGVTDDGRLIIQDPNGNNYRKGDSVLNDGYANGFNDSTIVGQWSGCWLIEPAETYREREGIN